MGKCVLLKCPAYFRCTLAKVTSGSTRVRTQHKTFTPQNTL